MCDEWMPLLQLPLTREQFDQLPRNPAYRYDFLDGVAWLNPRPRYYHATLDLEDLSPDLSQMPPGEVETRPLAADDWEPLVEVFKRAFRVRQPFAGMPDETFALTAQLCLDRTRNGHDGPVIERASFVAEENGVQLGVAIVTLMPEGDPDHWDTYYWSTTPPPDCIETRQGQPHLTWIFVRPDHAGRGIATALLGEVAHELAAMGFPLLLSTFLLGNESSIMWHWRVGFRLVSYPGSTRRYFTGG